MRVVLVDNLLIEQNGTRVETVLQPHLGLISLLAVVQAAGHDGYLYDPKLSLAEGRITLDKMLYREIARDLVALEPDVLGLTSLGCNFICTLKVAQHFHRLVPDVPILLGGPHATILDREILARYQVFDAVLRHEAEATLPAVLANLHARNLVGIPGLSFRDGDKVVVNPGAPVVEDLDQLPVPSYDHYPIERLGLRWLRVEAGRGCPFMCTFCSTASFFGRQYRLKSPTRLCGELDALNARYGVRSFSLQHDLFTVNREKVLAFCDEVGNRGYEWKCSARMDCVDPSLLHAMAAAGCSEIYFGVETGSPRLQHLSKKRLDLTLFYPTLDAADAAGIRPTVSFITGYPQENKVDQAATLDMIGSCFYRRPPPGNVQLHLMTPEPGTELLAEFADRLAFDGFISDFTFPTLEPDDGSVIAAAPAVFMNNHYFEAELPRRRHVLVSSLYYLLYDLSPPVLCLLIDHFSGRLSVLMDAFDDWAASRGLEDCTRAGLVTFVEEIFGSADAISSLVRYMAALSSMSRPSRRQVVAPRAAPRVIDAWTVNPEARVLRDIHDCGRLLEILEEAHAERLLPPAAISIAQPLTNGERVIQIHGRRGAAPIALLRAQMEQDWDDLVRRHPPLSLPADPGPRGDFLVVPVNGTDQVRNLPLDPQVSGLFDIFARPRSLREVKRAMGGRRADELLTGLRRMEILVPAFPRTQRAGIGAQVSIAAS